MARQFAARSSSRRLFWLLLSLCFAGGLLARIWWGSAPPDDHGTGAKTGATFVIEEAPIPPITASRYLNAASAARYIGTEGCRECHRDEYASYQQTAHRRSLAEVKPEDEPPDSVFDHLASSRRFSVYRSGGKLRHREQLLPPDGPEQVLDDRALRYLVGSGRFTRSYLIQDGEFLVESPVTWYASLQRWAMSPGFDRPDHPSFHRVVTFDCLYCHAGRLELSDGSAERVSVLETSIGCERCHGPGSLHADKWQHASADAAQSMDDTIVNPRHLSRELAEAICHQCHLASDVSVAVRGRKRGDFRPGLLWQDFAVNYSLNPDRGAMTVTGHVEQLQQSRCYQNSDTLSCLTCHDPHDRSTATEKLAQHQQVCLSCHDQTACGLSQQEREARNDGRCVACHMPNSTTDIPHIAFTHHRIAIHQNGAAANERPAEGEPRPILNIDHHSPAERQRSLGLAYWTLAGDERFPQHQADYFAAADKWLREAASRGVADASVCAALAETASFHGDAEEAATWAARALGKTRALAEDHLGASNILARIDLQNEQYAAAAERLKQLVSQRLDPADWFLLGLCQQRLGQIDDAVESWEHVLALDPTQPETYDLLAPLYNAQGKPDREAWCRERAKLLRQTPGFRE